MLLVDDARTMERWASESVIVEGEQEGDGRAEERSECSNRRRRRSSSRRRFRSLSQSQLSNWTSNNREQFRSDDSGGRASMSGKLSPSVSSLVCATTTSNLSSKLAIKTRRTSRGLNSTSTARQVLVGRGSSRLPHLLEVEWVE